MSGERIDLDQVKAEVSQRANSRKEESVGSTIAFPIYDLDAAIGVARNVYARAGLGPCPLDELAAESNTTMSGNFRNKNSAARQFGLIQKDGQSSLKLTDLGARIVSPDGEADARVAAFLNVPLYFQVYEKYRGKLLPPSKALEREMVTLGVIATQSAVARQIFQRSARQAGFSNSGDDRLVRPRATGTSTENFNPAETIQATEAPTESNPKYKSGLNGGGGGGYHPFVAGLLERLPQPDTVWSIEGRAAWLEAAASVFKLIYQGDGRITIITESKADVHG